MQITVIKSGLETVASFDGRLDASTSVDAEPKLLALVNEGAVIADLENVNYISSAGLRLLLKAAKLAKGAGFGFVVCALQPTVREAFEISGFNKIIPAFPTRAEACISA
jgi:anti-anti-sigma factor